MALQNPIANINDVNVLLHDDVAGENAVVDPIAQTHFGRRSVWPRGAIDVAGEVVRFAANDVAEGAAVDALDHLDEGGAIANLEADVKAELAFRSLADIHDFLGAGNVDRDRLLQINMLAAADNGVEMLRVIVGRRGDDDGI